MDTNKQVRIAFGHTDLIMETGHLARQANAAVTVSYGGTVVLVTACMSREPRAGVDFFPLTVECQERTYAAGRIPGGFFKREGRPSESEILTARLIDRPIRPLFPKGMFNEVQIMAIVLSSDGENDPDVLAVTGASAALSLSDIPFNGPLACCRVARGEAGFVLNPTYAQLEKSDLDLVVVANDNGIMMLESKCKETTEEVYMEAVRFAYEELKRLIALQREFVRSCGIPKAKIEYKLVDRALKERVASLVAGRLKEVYSIGDKEKREDAVHLLLKEVQEKLSAEEVDGADVKMALVELEKEEVRQKIMSGNVRIDGRTFTAIRPITCEVSVLPRTHGSSVFTRGQTQSLAVTTLGTGDDEQLVEALEGEKYKTFMLHYSFPPFSVGETGPVRGPGRREIGHGALAERSLLPVIPTKDAFPYTIRVVSEILESNGSSSMATVCAATLSLMDAGVPIRAAVSGIALGLIKEGSKALVLTDITGLEDHFGDMDFKVAGTRNGMTAVQLDLKINGIDIELLERCLKQSHEGRMLILDKIAAALENPRPQISTYAPRIEKLKVRTEKIGELIGPGGKTIKKIIALTGTTIDIEDDGTVIVASDDVAKSAEAIKMIKAIADDVEVGKVYTARVKRITNFGAFCEIAPGKEGLVRVSELADRFVKTVEEVVKVGDEVKVKVVGVDELGRINLSKKQAEDKNTK